MTFYGDEIGLIPTMTQIEIYIAKKGFNITPQEVWDYWGKKNWTTKHGCPVKTLESAISVVNGLLVYNGRKLNGDSKRKRKKEKKEIRKELQQEAIALNQKVKAIADYKNLQKQHAKYKEQLSDKRWKAFRVFVFVVRGKECEMCKAKSKLQIHHLHYIKDAKAWEYTCNDVMVVCDACHKKLHGL